MTIKFLCVGAALLSANAAQARERENSNPPRWYVRLGLAKAIFDEGAKLQVGGASVPGASATLSDNWSVAAEGGYYFNDNVSVSLTVGIPPTTTLSGAGTLAGTGALTKIRYGPAVAAVAYHLTAFELIRPYVGAGINYTLIMRTRDALLQNAKVDDTVGPAIIAGVEVPINGRIAAFADYKKVWATTNARFDLPTPLGLAPGEERMRLDPTLLHAGLTYRF